MCLAPCMGLRVRERHLVPKSIVRCVCLRVAATGAGRRISDPFLFCALRISRAIARTLGVTLLAALALASALANETVNAVSIDEDLNQAHGGMTAAQVTAASRFGEAQIQNVGGRVRMLHVGQDPCSIQLDIGTNIRWERVDGPKDGTAAPADPPNVKAAEWLKGRKGCDRVLAVWVAGNLDFGFLRPSTATDRSDLKTPGLTLGADAKVAKGLVLGAALGYGRDQSDVGSDGSDYSAKTASATFYGSYEAFKLVFVDFALGNGNLAFDSTRWQNNSAPPGSRNGSQLFGSVVLSGVLQLGSLKLAPYGRFDRVRSQLDGFLESGPSADAPSYGSSVASENAVAAGLFASDSIALGRAKLESSLRIEQRWLHGASIDQSLAYADTPATPYLLVYDGASDSQTLGGVGLMLHVRKLLSLGVEYTYTGPTSASRSETVRAVMRAPF